MTTTGKESSKLKQVIQIIHLRYFLPLTTMVYYDDAKECKSHRCKVNKLHIYAFVADIDLDKMSDGSLCMEKMEGADSL